MPALLAPGAAHTAPPKPPFLKVQRDKQERPPRSHPRRAHGTPLIVDPRAIRYPLCLGDLDTRGRYHGFGRRVNLSAPPQSPAKPGRAGRFCLAPGRVRCAGGRPRAARASGGRCQGRGLPSLTYNQPALAPNCDGPPGHRPPFTSEPSRCRRLWRPTPSTERFQIGSRRQDPHHSRACAVR